MQKNAKLPISHEVSVARLPQKGMTVRLSASPTELVALAKAHDLVSVTEFKAELLVATWRRDGVRVSGLVKASIVQTCSITLEALPAVIEADVDALFVAESSKLARPKLDDDGEMVLDADGPDAPETFTGDQLDIGAVAEEFFALSLDPYPRKHGAELEIIQEIEDTTPAKVSPFAQLAKLK